MKKNLLISIIIPTRNSEAYIEQCLSSIRRQTYKKIEIIISDGLSEDNTLVIAKKYKAKIVMNKKKLAEPGVSLGLKIAKGDILMIIAVDNIFMERKAIQKIVRVFDDKEIYAAFPKHESTKEDNLFTKYINTFTDPFNHFIYGYAANSRTFSKVFKTLEQGRSYNLYDFNSSKVMPILALAQGFAVRKDFLSKRRNEMDDIEPVLKLIHANNKIAYVHSVNLYHHTVSDMDHFIRKQRWATKNALTKEKFGINSRLNLLTHQQKILIYIYPFYSLSLIFPIMNSIYHVLKDGELMWLFHPPIVFISAISIISEYVKIKLGYISNVSRS